MVYLISYIFCKIFKTNKVHIIKQNKFIQHNSKIRTARKLNSFYSSRAFVRRSSIFVP